MIQLKNTSQSDYSLNRVNRQLVNNEKQERNKAERQ